MKSTFIFVCFLVMCICSTNPYTITASTDTNLRISELLPYFCNPLAIDPFIPANFIALSPNGTLDPYDGIYWGPKDVLESYFENPSSLNSPILCIRLSPNVIQTGINSFCASTLELLKELEKLSPDDFESTTTRWGIYPIVTAKAKIEEKLHYIAWVGLNNMESGWTLIFNLVYPDKRVNPNEEDRALWENLLKKTTQLNNRDYFKAHGQDLHEGYTLVNVAGAKLKMIAEKRENDGQLQVVVIPETPNTEFNYFDMTECLMIAEWRHGDPMIKVHGEVVISEGCCTNVINQYISIFFNTVSEFSLKKEEVNDKNYLFFQKNNIKND